MDTYTDRIEAAVAAQMPTVYDHYPIAALNFATNTGGGCMALINQESEGEYPYLHLVEGWDVDGEIGVYRYSDDGDEGEEIYLGTDVHAAMAAFYGVTREEMVAP